MYDFQFTDDNGSITYICAKGRSDAIEIYCNEKSCPKEYVKEHCIIRRIVKGERHEPRRFEAIKSHAKEQHTKRVADNSNRIQYAVEQFEKHNIEFVLKNEQTGHFHRRRKSDDKLFQFYAGTGKIMGFENKRGVHTLIQMLDDTEGD